MEMVEPSDVHPNQARRVLHVAACYLRKDPIVQVRFIERDHTSRQSTGHKMRSAMDILCFVKLKAIEL